MGAVTIVIGLNSCATIPKGAIAVKPFDKGRYLGKWYEIARMDFRFEKNLKNVTAEYSIKNANTIRVDNKGYNYIEQEWKESIRKAKFVNEPDEARLKVSFFGPLYSGYNVIAIDENYQYAMVAGNNLKYLWLLSRERTMPAKYITLYLKQAQHLGYNVNKLIWTAQD